MSKERGRRRKQQHSGRGWQLAGTMADGGESSKAETLPGSGEEKKEDACQYPNQNEFYEDKRQHPIQKSEGIS